MGKDKSISFRASEEFVDLLDSLSKELGESKTKVIEKAIALFIKSGKVDITRMENQDGIIKLLNNISNKEDKSQMMLDNITVLCLQILKNQQSAS